MCAYSDDASVTPIKYNRAANQVVSVCTMALDAIVL